MLLDTLKVIKEIVDAYIDTNREVLEKDELEKYTIAAQELTDFIK